MKATEVVLPRPRGGQGVMAAVPAVIPAGVLYWQVIVARVIDSYRPVHASAAWDRVSAEVRQIVSKAEPLTPYAARELMSVLSRLALFADGLGIPAEAGNLLTRPMIEQFITVGCAGLSEATRGNYRSRLLRIREAIIGVDNPTGKPIKLSSSTASRPYADVERAGLWSCACGQPTEELRVGMKLLLALGFGCGLESADIVPLRAGDVLRRHTGEVEVTVCGSRPRQVICRANWEQDLLKAAKRLDDPAVFLFRPAHLSRGKNTVTNFVSRTHAAPGTPALNVNRLRATWLVELMDTGTPLPVILAASGPETLHGRSRLMPYVSSIPAPQAARSLRGNP